jgi:hypothetical protein
LTIFVIEADAAYRKSAPAPSFDPLRGQLALFLQAAQLATRNEGDEFRGATPDATI